MSSEVKFISHTKFPKKVLLWLPEVASFIKKYYKGKDVVFWPDLASVHYSKRSF